MDRLLTMQVFQAVADEGGFAAAARALDMSPAAVTRCVADLERDVGARLLQRTTRQVSLTNVGEAYLARVRGILGEVDAARAAAQEYTGGMAGVLRVCAEPVLAAHILAPLVAEFRALNPAVFFQITVDAGRELPVTDYDMTLMGAPAGLDADVIARPFSSTVGILCASPGYLARNPAPATPEELGRHDCLLGRAASMRGGVVQLNHPGDANRVAELALQPVCMTNHSDTLLGITLNGGGIGFLSVNLVASHLRDGSLVRVLAPWTWGRFTLYAVVPSRKFMPARTRAFLDFLSERTRSLIQQALG